MPIRLVFGGLLLLVACGKSSRDEHGMDGGQLVGDIGVPVEVPIDAAPDSPDRDTRPPEVASVTPAAGSPVWLHAPIRIRLDEPIDAASVALTVSARAGGTAVPAELAFDPPSTLTVTFATTARGVGSLDINLAGSIKDLAGNAHTEPIALSFTLPVWSAVGEDRGFAASTPELAVDARGNVYAAWLVGGTSRRIVVSELVANTWIDLGGALGSGNVSSVALALDQNDNALVAWSEDGQAHVARWTGSAWDELASPGAADHVALATPPNGAPLLAVFGALAGVRELAGSSWQVIGTDIAVPSTIVGVPALATAAPGRAAIGWIDAQNQLRVYRYDSGWSTLAPIAVGPGSHISLAARGATLAVAWDQLTGSYGVLAAQASGAATTWTRLGRALDVDITGNAVAPAIAIDASGSPFVAWTELVETEQRGVLARWTGAAWSIVGGASWLDDAQAVPTGARIALQANEAAVVASSGAGRIRVARLNGPRVGGVGIASRTSLAGCAFDAANPPLRLSDTGCFTVATAGRPVPHPGLIPFDVVSELWSDGAKKRRYIGLPDGGRMSTSGNGAWVAPVGTIMIKQFDLERTPGVPGTRRAIETRFLVNDPALGWSGFSYRWNTAGTDATLQADGPASIGWPMNNGSQHVHFYPSRGQCRSCHNPSMGPLLGVRSEQLARWNDYGGTIADQLATLLALGVSPTGSATPFISPHEPGETPERRMRGYMAANCVHCHNSQNIAILDLRYSNTLAQTRFCNVVTPGSPATSRAYQLVTSRPGMPALGSLAVDPLAEQMLGAWITGMTSCP
jgi:hypothetical protein